MTSSSVRRVVETLLIAAFLAAICLPLTGKLLPSEGSFALTENRRPAPFPTFRLSGSGWGWTVASFPRRFERYWNDSFAFRWYLIRAHSIAKLALGASPSPKVLLGVDGFLYYAAEESVEYFRGTRPFTDADLARWRDDLVRRQKWLADRGIRYRRPQAYCAASRQGVMEMRGGMLGWWVSATGAQATGIRLAVVRTRIRVGPFQPGN